MNSIYSHLSEKSKGEYLLDRIKNKSRRRFHCAYCLILSIGLKVILGFMTLAN